MHPRRYQQPAQATINSARYPQVAVMKKDYRQRDGFIKQELRHREAEQRQHSQPHHEGEDHFNRVKSHPRTGIHFSVRMVDGVESPQEWHAVVETVPPILPAIEK